MKRISLVVKTDSTAYTELLDLIKEYLGGYIDDILIEEVNENEWRRCSV